MLEKEIYQEAIKFAKNGQGLELAKIFSHRTSFKIRIKNEEEIKTMASEEQLNSIINSYITTGIQQQTYHGTDIPINQREITEIVNNGKKENYHIFFNALKNLSYSNLSIISSQFSKQERIDSITNPRLW